MTSRVTRGFMVDHASPVRTVGRMNKHQPKGEFYVFEGGNGVGKTTVLKAVAERLRSKLGEDKVVTLYNPTTGPIGMELRRFLSEQRERGFPPFFTCNKPTEAFAQRLAALFIADRFMLQETIDAAVSAGKTVLCDRYALSTLVYQCAMVGDIHLRGSFASWIINGHRGMRTPNETIVMDVPVELSRNRLLARGERRLDDTLMATIEPAAQQMYRDYCENNTDGDMSYRHSVIGSTALVDASGEINAVVDEVMDRITGIPF